MDRLIYADLWLLDRVLETIVIWAYAKVRSMNGVQKAIISGCHHRKELGCTYRMPSQQKKIF